MRGFEDWSMEDVIRHNEKIKPSKKQLDYLQAISNGKKSKYGANKCSYNGIRFDSQKERDRYIELSNLQRAGVIQDLKLQVPFVLQDGFEINGKKVRSIKYIADFTYMQDGEVVIEDVKGKRTQVYDIKKKMFMYRYKKYIREV